MSYRGDEMAYVDIIGKPESFYALALPEFVDKMLLARQQEIKRKKGNKAKVQAVGRRGPDARAILDGAWHTVQCDIGYAPVFIKENEVFQRKAKPLVALSVNLSRRMAFDGVDQTGCYSALDFDEISFGPALHPSAMTNFAFRATYDAPNGLARCQYAITRTGSAHHREMDSTVVWHDFTPVSNDWTRPLPEKLEDGRYHLLLRASDSNGRVSKTAVVPFMIDSRPPRLSEGKLPEDLSLTGMPRHFANQLQDSSFVAIEADGDDGAPPTFSNLKFFVNGTETEWKRKSSCFSYFHEDNIATFALNWPVALHDIIQDATNGTEIALSFGDVIDGAGNKAAPLDTSIKLDYSRDKHPPTLDKPIKPPCLRSAFKLKFQESFFDKTGPGVAKQIKKANAKTNITFKTYRTTDSKATHFLQANFKKGKPWKIDEGRWLLFKLRVPGKSMAMVTNQPLFTLSFATDLENGKPVELDFFATTNALPPYVHCRKTISEDEFFDFALDVPAFLEASLDGEPPEKINLFSLVLPDRKGYALDIAAAAIMDDWPDDQEISLVSYDESGIEGLYLGENNLSANRKDVFSITPAEIKPWLSPDVFLPFFRLRDKAGNEPTEGFVIPVPPRP